MNIDILRTNANAVSLLAGIGVNIGDAASQAQAARAKLMEQKTAEEAQVIAGLIGGFEAAAIANVGNQVELQERLVEAQKSLTALTRAKDYMMATGTQWPLKALMNFPIPVDIKKAKLDEVPTDWTPPAAASTSGS